MLKGLLILLLTLGTLAQAKKIVVVGDISQGMNAKEAKELVDLMNPKTLSIYKDNDMFYGYIFTENGRMKTKGKFVEKSTSKKAYKSFFKKQYNNFYAGLKKGLNKGNTKVFKQKDVVFLIDTSGSMKKNNLMDRVKKSLNNLVLDKQEKVRISIVTFDGHRSFKQSKNARKILEFSSDINEIKSAIQSIKISKHDTYLGAGLDVSLDLLEMQSSKNKTIFVVTDGAAINDSKYALTQVDRAKINDIDIKVIAIGGASISMLKSFSTTGFVYDATSSDLKEELETASKNDDTLLENFSSLTRSTFSKKQSEGDVLIIYSTMMQVSNLYDFYMVPNLSDGPFYREVKKKLDAKNLKIDFNGMKVFVRLLGNPSAEKENEIDNFWRKFIKDHNGKVAYFSKDKLTQDEFE